MPEVSIIGLVAACSLLISHAGKVVSQYALEWSANEFQQRFDAAAEHTREQHEMRMRDGGVLQSPQYGSAKP